MAETYKKIYPGNWVNHLSALPLPNPDFTINKRPSGDPRDRQQQGVLVAPGRIAVHKVGFVKISGAVAAAGAGIAGYDVTIDSPDTRPDDKPRADVKGLLVPQGAAIYRVGFRIPPLNQQPNFSSSGARGPVAGSGLQANAGAKVWLEARATTPTAAPANGVISATGANTPALTVGADGEFDPAQAFARLATPVTTTAELTLRLWADQGGLGSSFLDGVYLTAEVCYLVDDAVPDLSWITLPGGRYSGYTG